MVNRSIRPRRSLLYMPGSNARALEKGRTLPCDGLIMDLEDSVAPAEKAAARAGVETALKRGGYGHRELLIRINGLDTPWGVEDLRVAASSGADGVVIPKVDSAKTVQRAADLLQHHQAPADLKLWAMMETPLGVLRAEQIVFSTPRLAGLIMGTSDLAKDLHCLHTPDRLPFITALGLSLIAARAARCAIIDGVHLNLSDPEGFTAACAQGRQFGFDGKSLIHPKQIDAANAAFSPSSEEVAWARRITAAHSEAVATGRGVVVVDGRLVEHLHVEDARRLIAMDDAIAAATAAVPAQ